LIQAHPAADVWSGEVVMFELLTRKHFWRCVFGDDWKRSSEDISKRLLSNNEFPSKIFSAVPSEGLSTFLLSFCFQLIKPVLFFASSLSGYEMSLLQPLVPAFCSRGPIKIAIFEGLLFFFMCPI
jgi:hypothetical protein